MPLGSAFGKNMPGGNFTSRPGANMNISMPGPAGGSNLVGSLSYMGKTTLFSRVALSPNAMKGGDKKAQLKEDSIAKGGIGSSNDLDTSVSTQAGATGIPNQQAAMGKTIRSSTTTSTFKETIQRGILSGAGILKK